MIAEPIDPERSTSASTGLPILRWAMLVALLLIEALALSTAFDAAKRGQDPGWAGHVVAWIPAIFRWGFVAVGLGIAFAFWLLQGDVWAVLRSPYPARRLAFAIVGQVAAYGMFALSTSWVLGRDEPIKTWQLVAWLSIDGVTVGMWALAMLPPRIWPTLLRKGRHVWMLAAVVAGLTTVVARIARDGWDLLSEPTMQSANNLLQTFLPDIVYDPETHLLGTTDFRVRVGVPCSGYEGLGLMGVYLVVYLTLFRRNLVFPRAFLLVPIAMMSVWLANVLRLVALVYIGDRISPALAVGGFHSQAGWVGFNAVAVGLLFLAHRSRLFTRDVGDAASGPDSTPAYLAPLLGAIGVQMIAVALSSQPESLYPIRALFGGRLLIFFWRRYSVLRMPGRDSASLGLLWAVTTGAGVFLLWVALVPPEPIRVSDEWPTGQKALGSSPAPLGSWW